MLPLFAFYNVCIILLAVGLYSGTEKEVRHVWGAAFLVAAASGGLLLMLLSRANPLAPGEIILSMPGVFYLTLTGFIALCSIAAIALFWRQFRLDLRWKDYDKFSMVMLPIVIACTAFGILALSTPYAGLGEKISIGSVLLWMEVASIGLMTRGSRVLSHS
jgi:hypothetical protein